MGDSHAQTRAGPRGCSASGGQLVAIAAVVVGLLGAFLCLGLPGWVLYQVTNRLIFGGDPWARIPDDGAWPLAIYLSLLWPVGVAPAYQVATRVYARREGRRPGVDAAALAVGAGGVVVLAWGVYLAVCAYFAAWWLILISTLAALAGSLWLGRRAAGRPSADPARVRLPCPRCGQPTAWAPGHGGAGALPRLVRMDCFCRLSDAEWDDLNDAAAAALEERDDERGVRRVGEELPP